MALFAFLIAGSFALGGQTANLIDPGALTAARFVIASAFMAGRARAGQGVRRSALTTAPWRYLIMGGLLSVYFVLMFEALKIAGCDDAEILEVNQVCAYFNYSNRLLNGLGATTEGDVGGYYTGGDAD